MSALDSLVGRVKAAALFVFYVVVSMILPFVFATVGLATGFIVASSNILSLPVINGLYYIGIDLPANRITDFFFFLGFMGGFVGSVLYPVIKAATTKSLDELGAIMDVVDGILPRLKEHEDKLKVLEKKIDEPILDETRQAPAIQHQQAPTLRIPEPKIISPLEVTPPPPAPHVEVKQSAPEAKPKTLKDFDSRITDKIEGELAKAGIFDVEGLAGFDLEALRKIVGKKAEYLSDKAKAEWAKSHPEAPVVAAAKVGLGDSEDLTILIPVITPEIEIELGRLGVFSIGDLSKCSLDFLKPIFGDEKKANYVLNKAKELK